MVEVDSYSHNKSLALYALRQAIEPQGNPLMFERYKNDVHTHNNQSELYAALSAQENPRPRNHLV